MWPVRCERERSVAANESAKWRDDSLTHGNRRSSPRDDQTIHGTGKLSPASLQAVNDSLRACCVSARTVREYRAHIVDRGADASERNQCVIQEITRLVDG